MAALATKEKKTKSKTKLCEIEGKRVYLPKGISAEAWRGKVLKLIVTKTEHGKSKRVSFP